MLKLNTIILESPQFELKIELKYVLIYYTYCVLNQHISMLRPNIQNFVLKLNKICVNFYTYFLQCSVTRFILKIFILVGFFIILYFRFILVLNSVDNILFHLTIFFATLLPPSSPSSISFSSSFSPLSSASSSSFKLKT